MKLILIFGYFVFAIFIVCLALGFGYSLMDLERDKNKFYECDDIYDIGDCSLYQCKMNHSINIDRSWGFYDLYHECLIKEKDCESEAEE